MRAVFAMPEVRDLGGYISDERNLDHTGPCWVYDEAKVYGSSNAVRESDQASLRVMRGSAVVCSSGIMPRCAADAGERTTAVLGCGHSQRIIEARMQR